MATQARRPLQLTPTEIIGSIVVVALFIVFLNLAFWQLRRLNERVAFNTRFAARMTEPPLDMDAVAGDTAGVLYRRIILEGDYDNERAVVLPGRSLNGSPGVHLFTPLILHATRTAVLVNRGWVPSPDAATVPFDSLRAVAPPTLIGIVLPFPQPRDPEAAHTDPSARTGAFRRVWYNFDETAVRAQYPYILAPFVVQLLPEAGLRGYPRRLDPPAMDQGPHLGYALQWFAFAAIALIGWTLFLIRSRAQSGVRAPPFPE